MSANGIAATKVEGQSYSIFLNNRQGYLLKILPHAQSLYMRIGRRFTLSYKSKPLYLNKYDRRKYSTWRERIIQPRNRVQAYVSSCQDPCINLALEKYIFQTSGPDTFILLFYVNKPSIIIGRNQNPWLEANLDLVRHGIPLHNVSSSVSNDRRPIKLLRRISGGGTVFHDEGNVNWTVICPPASFTRDKHAEMVTRALQFLGKRRVQVNKRHDITLLEEKSFQSGVGVNSSVSQASTYDKSSEIIRARKISGSAYKLTRLRALHHGTCLLSSPNLQYISRYLESPAKPYIQARGVESVSSPIANIGVSSEEFIDATSREFFKLYGSDEKSRTVYDIQAIDDEGRPIHEIKRNSEELNSAAWTYGQTPQFTFSIGGNEKVSASQPPLPLGDITDITFSFKVRSGIITESNIVGKNPFEFGDSTTHKQKNPLIDLNLYSLTDWDSVLNSLEVRVDNCRISDRLKKLFPEKHMLP